MTQRTRPPRTPSRAAGAVAATIAVVETQQQEPAWVDAWTPGGTETLLPGDTLRVNCTHDATLRRLLPALSKLPPLYVVRGDDSSDEVCLGLLTATFGSP